MNFNALLSAGAGQTVLSVVLAILILLAMITVHEFGHFVAGRALGFSVDEFSIGFGPALLKVRGKKRGTLFSVRALPLGGYCAFTGEDGECAEARSFNNMHPLKRIVVLVAGATFNYIAALLIIIAMTFAFGQAAYRVNAVEYDPAYPAEYSLCDGDVITAVNGRDIYLASDLVSALNGMAAGQTAAVDVVRGGESVRANVMLRADCFFKNSSSVSAAFRALGVDTFTAEDGEYYDLSSVNCKFTFWESLSRSFVYSFKMAGSIFTVLGELLTGNLGLSAVGGPVTTIKLTGEMAVQGMQSFLLIAAWLGVNLAVFNLLPIPALDGSKVVFCLIEWIFKKPVPRKIEQAVHVAGLFAIIAFAVAVDILQFV